MVNIKQIGDFATVDAEGFIVNTASVDKIQDKWRAVVEVVIDEYRRILGANLHSVYLRGSVAQGRAVEGISDVDTFAATYAPVNDRKKDELRLAKPRLMERFKFVQDIEVIVTAKDRILQNCGDRIMLVTQAVCIYGPDLSKQLPRLKPGKECVQHVFGIERELIKTLEWLGEDRNSAEVRQKCTWIMKRVLRTGSEIAMQSTGKYTRDLYLSYKLTAEVYPQVDQLMYACLQLALEPTDDVEHIAEVLKRVHAWLIPELKRIT